MSQKLDELRAGGASLEDIVKEKFKHLSMDELIARIHRAADFGWDDEGVELSRRCEEQGLGWRFGRYSDRIQLYKKEDALTLGIKVGMFTWGDVTDANEGRDDAGRYLRNGDLSPEVYEDVLQRIAAWEAARKEGA